MKIIWIFTLLMIPGVMSSISVTGYSGGEVIITCKYEEKYTENAKYFCKGQNPGCADLIKTKEKEKWVHSGRFSLYDDTRAAVFNVTIRDLSEQDSGTYQCASDISLGGDSYTEVNLIVITDTDLPKATSSLLPSTPSSTIFKTSTSNITPGSSNMLKVFSGSSLIISLVLVLMVLIIVGVLLLFLYKKHRSQGGDSSSQTGAGKPELIHPVTVSHTGCNYENIKDTQKQLPTNPSDSSNTVYVTAELPTNLSVSSDCVYSTVQEPTGDSQILITSAEDLNYAVVNFQKKADCPDSVSLRNNQDYSEYAAVNHLTA